MYIYIYIYIHNVCLYLFSLLVVCYAFASWLLLVTPASRHLGTSGPRDPGLRPASRKATAVNPRQQQHGASTILYNIVRYSLTIMTSGNGTNTDNNDQYSI